MIIPEQIETASPVETKSTGPRTEEGKKRSSLNAIKHGLAGDVMTLAAMRREEFEQRLEAWRDLYSITTDQDEWIYERFVAESIRLDECRRLVRQTTLEFARRAFDRWDEEQAAEAGELAKSLPKSPTVASRRLRTTKHGCELLAEMWEGLARALKKQGDWDDTQKHMALDLLGVNPSLRVGYPLFELNERDKERKLVEERERFVLAEIEKLRRLIETKHSQDGDLTRDAARQGVFVNMPKQVATAYRYEKESDRRFFQYKQLLRANAPPTLSPEDPHGFEADSDLEPEPEPESVPVVARPSAPEREAELSRAPEPRRRAATREASLGRVSVEILPDREPTKREIDAVTAGMIEDGLYNVELSRETYSRIFSDRLNLLMIANGPYDDEFVDQRC